MTSHAEEELAAAHLPEASLTSLPVSPPEEAGDFPEPPA